MVLGFVGNLLLGLESFELIEEYSAEGLFWFLLVLIIYYAYTSFTRRKYV